jgi:predicted signal transduction protein with EAL and GGDEF domain
VLALTLLVLIVRRRVIVPLLRTTRAVIRLGKGDYSRDPGGSQRPDEIGDMLRALSTLRNNSIERQQLELERQHLIEELRLRADTDYLTGILNRRAFTTAGAKRLRRARSATRHCRCCCSISTTSRRSTIPMAMRRATRC